jgi:uncharacterized protein (TIGR02118 family)
MARLVVLYKTPKDVGAFDAYYFNTHVPIAKKIPGLRTYEVSKGPVVTPTGPSASDQHAIDSIAFHSEKRAAPDRYDGPALEFARGLQRGDRTHPKA